MKVEVEKDIASLIEKSFTSFTLSLAGREINDQQAIEIVKKCAYKTKINLYNNKITDEGAKELAKYGILYFKSENFHKHFKIGISKEIFLLSNSISKRFIEQYDSQHVNNSLDQVSATQTDLEASEQKETPVIGQDTSSYTDVNIQD